MSNPNEWPCAHIKKDREIWVIYLGEPRISIIQEEWNVCPVSGCGAKRPEKKSLADKLRESAKSGFAAELYHNNPDVTDADRRNWLEEVFYPWKQVSMAAKEAFLELIDEERDCISPSWLRKRIEEM